MHTRHTFRVRLALATTAAGLLIGAAPGFAQAPPVRQPPPQTQPIPHDPTPVPAARPQDLAKPEPTPRQPAPAGRLTQSEARFTGCLQRAEDRTTATRPAGEPKLTGGYVLTQATTTRAKDAEKGGAAAPGAKEYRVVTKDDGIKLSEHVGHQVELKGRIALDAGNAAPTSTDSSVSSSRPSGSTGVSTTPPPAGETPAAAPAVTLEVTALKMVSASCTTPASN